MEDLATSDEPTLRVSMTPRPSGSSYDDADTIPRRQSLRWGVEDTLAALDTRPHAGHMRPGRYGMHVLHSPTGIQYSAYAEWVDESGTHVAQTLDDHGSVELFATQEAAWGRLLWVLEERLITREYERRCIERERELARGRSLWTRVASWLSGESVAC